LAEIYHVQNPIISHAKQNGWFVRRVQWIGRHGAPDLVLIKGGVTLWFEAKREGKDAEIHQQREHARMRTRGALVYVIDRADEGCRILDRHDPDAI
jgi:3-mercaptopyruvate sulfurtransferase SseA